MTIYAVGQEWEYNDRDDSDWHQCGFDTETGTITRYEIGTTRFANASPVNLPEPPAELLPKIKATLADMWFAHIVFKHEQAVEHPSKDHLLGQRVEFKKAASTRERATSECRKCAGSGHWTNPRNTQDVRKCFTCDGTGTHVGPAVKGGKMIKRAAGLQGVVVDVREYRSQYGTFSTGTSVKVRLDNGEVIRANHDNLRIVCAPIETLLPAIRRAAEAQAERLNAYALFPTSHYSAMGLTMPKLFVTSD